MKSWRLTMYTEIQRADVYVGNIYIDHSVRNVEKKRNTKTLGMNWYDLYALKSVMCH